MRTIKFSILISLLFWGVSPYLFAGENDRYWICDAEDNWSNTNCWSKISGGGAFGGVPISTHNVYFNSAGIGKANLDMDVTVASITIMGGYSGIIETDGFTLTMSSGFKQTEFSSTIDLTTSVVYIGRQFKHYNGTFDANTSTVNLIGPNLMRLEGDTTFYALRALTAGTTYEFRTWDDFTVKSMIDFQNVIFRPYSSMNHWFLSMKGSSQTVKGVDVAWSNASRANTINATDGSFGNNCMNWNFGGGGMTYVWDNGGGGSSWDVPLNWNPDGVPANGDNVVFNAGVSNANSYANIDVNLNSFDFIGDYTGTVTIAKDVIVGSSITVPLNATIEMNGGHLSAHHAGDTYAFYIQGTIQWYSAGTYSSTITAKGVINIANNGRLKIGSSGMPIPTNAPAYVILDEESSPGSAYIRVQNGGQFQTYGYDINPFTRPYSNINSGVNNFSVFSPGDIAGWQVGDVITVGKTSTNGVDETEKKKIISISSPWITVDSNFSYSHSTYAAVNNLSRSVKIYTADPSKEGYVHIESETIGDVTFNYTEFKGVGRTAGQPGIKFVGADVEGNLNYCSVYEGDYEGIYISQSSSITLNGNIIYKFPNQGIYLSNAPNNTITNNHIYSNGDRGLYLSNSPANLIDGNWVYGNNPSGMMLLYNSSGNFVTNNKAFSNSSNGIYLNQGPMQNFIEQNEAFFNGANGIALYRSDGNLLEWNESRQNAGSGFEVDQSSYNVLIENNIYLNATHGVTMDQSNVNWFVEDEIYDNTGRGFDVTEANENIFMRSIVYDNNYGFYSSLSDDNIILDGRLGYDYMSMSNPNNVSEIYFLNNTNNLIMRNCWVNMTNTDVDTTNFSAPGRSLISYRHNQMGGKTRIYGDFVADDEDFVASYFYHTYKATATETRVLAGAPHTVNVSNLSDSMAQTQLISIEYRDDYYWHVEGSNYGSMRTFTGNQTSLPVPLASPHFYLDFTQAGTPQVGDEIVFLVVSASWDSSMQKKVYFGPSAASFNDGGSRLTIPPGRNFNSEGSSMWPTLFDWLSGPGEEYYTILSSGSFNVVHTTFSHLHRNGITMTGSDTVSMTTSTFDRAMAGGGQYITPVDLDSTEIFSGMVFDDSDATTPQNVRTVGNTTNLDWTFVNWGGIRGGEPNDDDPDNKVTWLGGPALPTDLYPVVVNITTGSLTFDWTGIVPPGETYIAALSISETFAATLASGTLTAETTTYENLMEDTTYWFRVKIASETDTAYTTNHLSTQTHPIGTFLFPVVQSVSSSTIQFGWTGIAPPGTEYWAALSDMETFATTLASGPLTAETTIYEGLEAGTTYWFRVKVSTEADAAYWLNEVSTRTLFLGTHLRPHVIDLTSTTVSFMWEMIFPGGVQNTVALSDDINFTNILYEGSLVQNSTSYKNLSADTDYWFRVKIATEPDIAYSTNTVSTHTLVGYDDYALFFDGENDKARFGTNSVFNFSSDATIECWFKRGGGSGPNEIILSKENSAFNSGWMLKTYSDGKIRFQVMNKPGLQSTTGIFDTNWHHVAVTRQAANGLTKLYLDGFQEAEVYIDQVFTNGEGLKLGASVNGTNNFQGLIDEVRVWGLVKDQQEILHGRYQEFIGNEPSLNAYYNFNEGIDQYIYDQTSGGTNGQLGDTLTALSDDPIWWGEDPIPGLGQPVYNTPLNPYDSYVSHSALEFTWTDTADEYTVLFSSVASFDPYMSSGPVTNNTSSYINLDYETTYYFTVKVSTETDMSYSINETSATTLAEPGASPPLYPYSHNITSTSVSVSWDNVASSYTVVLASDAAFTMIIASAPMIPATTSYTDLMPNYIYHFKVKIGTETSDTYESLVIQTYTDLQPQFTYVGLNQIDVSWNDVQAANYYAELALDSGFSSLQESGMVSFNNKTYSGLTDDTYYYFRVRGSTEDTSYFGEVISTKTQAGGADSALSFDGNNKVAFIGHSALFEFTNDTTLEFWFRRSHTDATTSEQIIGKDNAGLTTGWAVFITPGEYIRFRSFGGFSIHTDQTIVDTNWHHFAVTRRISDGVTKLFLDGTQVKESVISSVPSDGGSSLKLGNSYSFNEDFYGVIDEVRIWDEERTEAQIKSNRKVQLTGSESNLVAYFDFHEGSGQTFDDLTSNPYSGDLGTTEAPEASFDPIWVNDPIPGFGAPPDSSNPTVTIDNPPDQSSVTVAGLTILSGTAQDNQMLSEVRLSIERLSDNMYWWESGAGSGYWAAAYNTVEAGPPNNWTYPGIDVTWSTGTYYQMIATAEDGNFNVASATSNFYVTVSTDYIPPSISILHPVDGSTYADDQLVSISGTAFDDEEIAVIGVSITRDSDNYMWDKFAGGGGQWVPGPDIYNPADGEEDWILSVPLGAWFMDGSYTIEAVAKDLADNTNSDSIQITLDNGTGSGGDTIIPTVQVIHPADGSTHGPDGLYSLHGTASDNIDVVQLSIWVQDKATELFWNGATFSNATPYWINRPNPEDWYYSGVGSSFWTDGHEYILQARAKDGAGNFGYASSTFTFDTGNTSDTIAPQVTINNPQSGLVYSPDTVNFDGTASDNVGLQAVEFSLKKDGSIYYYDGVGFTAPYQTFFPVQTPITAWAISIQESAFENAGYTLVVVATDTSGLTTEDSVSFTIDGASNVSDPNPPSVEIMYPVDGISYSDPNELSVLSGTAFDDLDLVEVKISVQDDLGGFFNGSNWDSTTEVWKPVFGLESWQKDFPINAWKNGYFQLRVRAVDGGSNVTYDMVNFSITGASGSGEADTTAPNNYVYNPAPAAVGGPYSFSSFNGQAEDPFGIQSVTLSLKELTGDLFWTGSGFTSSSEVLLTPYNSGTTEQSIYWYFDVPFYAYVDGNYELSVYAEDPSGNVNTKRVNFTVTGASGGSGDFDPPSISILTPAPGGPYNESELTVVSGTADDNDALYDVMVRIIQDSSGYYWDGSGWSASEVWLMASGLSDWSFYCPLDMWSDGDYTISAKASDMATNTNLHTVDITVSETGAGGTPPTVSYSFPVNGSTYEPGQIIMISGTADDDTSVTDVRIRITDLNNSSDYNPYQYDWENGDYWFSANLFNSGNDWDSSRMPAWVPGYYRIMVRAEDSDGLISISQSVSFYIQYAGGGSDTTPPGRIDDLTVAPGTEVGSVILTWTAVADDGVAGDPADAYAIKFRTGGPFTNSQHWVDAQDVSYPPIYQTPPTPQSPGTQETMTVRYLQAGISYFWAIRARDEEGNRSPISNSPLGTAFSGCTGGAGDGEGTATIVPASFEEMVMETATMTFTVGDSGITQGGKVKVKVPDNWVYPQVQWPDSAGYITVQTSNGSVTLSASVDGPAVTISVDSGNLNAENTITLTYLAQPSCGVQTGVEFKVLSMGSSCGVFTAIASQPTVDIIAGSATWLGFDSYEKFVPVGQATSFEVRGQNSCGSQAAVADDVTMNVSVVKWSSNSGQWIIDSSALLSAASNMSGSYTQNNVSILSGDSSLTLHYRINTVAEPENHYVRITYQDMMYPSYQSENTIRMIPTSEAVGISNVSVDLGTPGGSLQHLTITPNGDQVNDFAYINFEIGQQTSWQIQISNDGFSTILWERWGWGSLARESWDGRRSLYPHDLLPLGTYNVRIIAAGQQNNDLSIAISAVGVSGTLIDSSSSDPVRYAHVNMYGPVVRYTQTDAAGGFNIVGIPNGNYQLHIDKQGYKPHSQTVNVTGDVDLENISFHPLSRVELDATRSDTNVEIWGSLRAIGGAEQLFSSVHFAQGSATADDGMTSGNSPQLFLKSGVEYVVTADIPGYDSDDVTVTLTPGQIYSWTLSLTGKSRISGAVRLANGVVNNTGYSVHLGAGLDANSDGDFDLGYPSYFADTYIPAYESQANYSFPGMDDGTYLVRVHTEGLTPAEDNVTLGGSDQTVDFELSQAGSIQVTANFDSATTDLNEGSGSFSLTMRVVAADGISRARTESVAVSASASSTIIEFKGAPDGQYQIIPGFVEGFRPDITDFPVVTVNGGSGSTIINYVAFTGSLVGTVSLPAGSAMGDLQISLSKDGTVIVNPIISGSDFIFNGLGSGNFELSVLDTNSGASYVQPVYIMNGQQTHVTVGLAAQTLRTVSGTVRTEAAPPYGTLKNIDASAVDTVFYTNSGTQNVPALRVEARLINPDGSVDPLPTVSGNIWDQGKIKYGAVNTDTGAYSITGLRDGVSYLLRLNPDFDSDGVPDIPLAQRYITLFANATGRDFTIRDGASIMGTLVAPSSDNGHNLTVVLKDVALNEDVQSASVSLVGTEASFEFRNLRVGSYLIRVEDAESPPVYAADPLFVRIDSASEQKTVSINLEQSAVIQGRLALASGELITLSNYQDLLPIGFKVRFVCGGFRTTDEIPTAVGLWQGVVPPGQCVVQIRPPQDQQGTGAGRGFLPITFTVDVEPGQVHDWGTKILERGIDLDISVEDPAGNPIANAPILAIQALAKTLPPIVILTDDLGVGTFEDLSPRVRFYDFIINKPGRADTVTDWTSTELSMVDITKPGQINNLSVVLNPVQYAVSGQINSLSSDDLVAAYGQYANQPGASILVRPRGERNVSEYLSNPDGSFSIPLADGLYDVVIMAQHHQPHRIDEIQMAGEDLSLGTIELAAGVKLEGTIRNADGSLPAQNKVDQLLAFDVDQQMLRAHLELEPTTEAVDRYVFHGLQPGEYDIVAVDELNRTVVLASNFDVPNQDSVLNLTFQVRAPVLTASFIQKLPDGVEALFNCNQAFRNNPDDLDGDGTPDDDEFDNVTDTSKVPHVVVTQGNGTLALDSFDDSTRQKIQYLYTEGNETGINALKLTATFNTEEINPETGTNFQVTGNFTHPFGLQAQQRDRFTPMGGELNLPNGSGLMVPEGWRSDGDEDNFDEVEFGFEQADELDDLDDGAGSSGLAALALANKLGAAAYPPRMYKAIRALADAPEVNPFSSFYDIFLPASVARVFTNTPTLTLKYDEDVTDPSSLNIYYYNEANGVYTIENNNRRIDTVNRTISVDIGHASVFTVLASSAPIIRGSGHSGELVVFNFPNPFDLNGKTVTLANPASGINPSQHTDGTMIKVSLPAGIAGAIEIDIFNVAGEKVATLRETAPEGGSHYYINWNGRNDSGKKVASGIYIGQLKVGGQKKFFKMAVIK
jgi:parallel beta-helix repeat protein